MNSYYVYILSNYTNSTLYIGVTNNLKKRLYEHKTKVYEGFSKKYNVDKLVYFEEVSDIKSAIQREKNLKKWKREWKDALIKKANPEFNDLSMDFE
ncbi:MAG: GIY-YIG nuclease family protein [Treponema sp.]|nr:GIY-YIG nuclease family protein [Treponema sp.]